MADPKDDASTSIDRRVRDFLEDINAAIEKLREARAKALQKADNSGDPKAKGISSIRFSLSNTRVSRARTPAQQAQLLVQGSTKVCWSSHMADRARHVVMKVDHRVEWNAKRAFGDDFAAFKAKWAEMMTKHGLRNASGENGWPSWDEFHLELPASKVPRSDERANSCLDEYARLTRKEGKQKNDSFERRYSELLKDHVDKYDKANTETSPQPTRDPGVPSE